MKFQLFLQFLLVPLFFCFPLFAKNQIRVGSSPVLSSAGIYLALEKNYFKDEGLDVVVTDFGNSGAPMTLLLAKGELEVGAGNLSSGLFNAVNQGQGVKIVADKGHLAKDCDYMGLLVRKDHINSGRFKSLKDLKGFKMGLTALDGVSQQILVEKVLEKAGLKPTDITYIKMSYAEMNVALKTKSIDATIQLEPLLSVAEKEGFAKKVIGGAEVYPEQQSAAILFSKKFIEEQRPEAVKFMKAYLKGVRDYNNAFVRGKDRDNTIAALSKHIKIVDADLWKKMASVGLSESGSVAIDPLYKDLEWYRAKGFLQKIPSQADLVDLSIADEANSQLKKH